MVLMGPLVQLGRIRPGQTLLVIILCKKVNRILK